MTYVLILVVGMVAAYALGLLTHDQVKVRTDALKAKIKKRLWG